MTILGIDLGTTNSACGIWTEDGVQLIPNRLQNNLTPSVVGIDKQGNVSVGQVAKDRLITHPDFTVGVFKRMMGTVHKIKLGKQQFTATELSALVLRSLKEDAEQFLGHSVEEAVISVPAYFNDNQRQATKSAGELAGFKVERLINEPTAAAMAYGLHEKKEGNFIILDMGGGTFDVSILEYFDGIMEVHASAGDNFLGGEDFVQILYDRILQENGISVDTVTKQEKHIFYQQLEKIKKEIDLLHGRTVQFKLAGQSLDWQVDKVWYEKMVTPLLLRVKKPIEQALRDSNIHSSNLEDIILVGGATKMKVFRSMVGRLFGRLPSCSLDPDVVVAMGASIQAGLKSRNKSLDDLVLTDVCPYTLGTNVVNESGDGKGAYFMPIIERNSVVPVSISRGLFTAHDNQDRLRIGIYQGENRYAEKNIYLGEVNVDIPKGPAGQEEAEVRYSYDMNGLLEVDVKVLSTNKQASIVIENAPGALSPSEKEKARKKLALIKFHPRDNEVNRAVISRGERLFEISLGEKREYVASLLSEFDKVLEKQNPNEIVKQRKIILEKFDDLDDNWL